MQITKRNTLNSEEIRKIELLQEKCAREEGLRHQAFLSNELNFDRSLPCFYLGYEGEELVAFLDAFFPQRGEAELFAITHPAYRRRGCFTALLLEARGVLERAGVTALLLMAEPNGKAAAEVRRRYPVHLERSEYRMELRREEMGPVKEKEQELCLIPASEKNKADCILIQQAAFGEAGEETARFVRNAMDAPDRLLYLAETGGRVIGTFSLHLQPEGAFLYGVGILPAEQRRGWGKKLMRLACGEAFQRAGCILLDVDSGNPPAYSLYLHCGFRVTFQVDYYWCSLSAIQSFKKAQG